MSILDEVPECLQYYHALFVPFLSYHFVKQLISPILKQLIHRILCFLCPTIFLLLFFLLLLLLTLLLHHFGFSFLLPSAVFHAFWRLRLLYLALFDFFVYVFLRFVVVLGQGLSWDGLAFGSPVVVFWLLTILELLLNNSIIKTEDVEKISKYGSESLISLLNKKIKNHYHFDFLSSKYYKQWIKDPIKISNFHQKFNNELSNKNCLKFPNHSKNIFSKNKEDYLIYIKLLVRTSCNFIFYFQNNPLKFGKKIKK